MTDKPQNQASADSSASRIEQLERAVADERAHAASLRSELDEVRFKTEILEKSYAKQLEDARREAESAEKRANESGERIAELDAARRDAIELLTEAQVELDRLTAERNQLRQQLATRDGWTPDEDGEELDFGEEGTINALMDDASWVRKKQLADDKPASDRQAEKEEPEPADEDMIAPELVFASARRQD